MNSRVAFALAALTSSLICSVAHAGELADDAVAKALGVSGVTHTSKTNNKYGMTYSDVSYKDGKGADLIVLRLGAPDQFAMWKQAMGQDSTPVSGVGSEAFRVKTFRAVCAKSATSAVCVTPSFVNKSVKISDEQIEALVSAAL